MRYLVYGLADPRDGQIFYVGKSCDGWGKAIRHMTAGHQRSDANTDKLRRIRAIRTAGYDVHVWPLAWCHSAEHVAQIETQIIRQWTRAGIALVNRTNNRAA